MGKLKIVVNGCSYTYGAESVIPGVQTHEDNFNNSYPILLDKKLKNGKVINLAACGKSNATIFCQTINYLFDNPYQNNDIVFIIQWTWPERWPRFRGKRDTNEGRDLLQGLWLEDNSAHSMNLKEEGYINELNFQACENLTYSYICALMNMFDNMNIRHLHYMSTSIESHLPKFWLDLLPDLLKPDLSPKFQSGPHREFIKYNLDNLINKIRNHDGFVMDNWSSHMMEKNKEKYVYNSGEGEGIQHPDKQSHQEWTDELIEILLNKGYISSEEIL
jgi:hypothetical protein|tara:strand:+ start:579 stop:1403 length:825 start_codon:yes stop_codon:yes gene_type:complete